MIRCPICGSYTQPNLETHNLCQNCYNLRKRSINEEHKLWVCSQCGALRVHGKWDFSLNLENYIEKTLINQNLVTSPVLLIKTKDRVVYDIITKNASKRLEFQLNKTICPNCLIQKNRSFLYELKIRIEGRNPTQQESLYLSNLVIETLSQLNDKFVYELNPNKNGIDVSFSTKRGLDFTLNKLRTIFIAKEIYSSRLVGEAHDRRKIFKTTVSFRIIPFAKGSVIRIKDQLFEIIDIQQKEFILCSLVSHSSTKMSRQSLVELFRKGIARTLIQRGELINAMK
ncbi:hypothetical protein B9Q11_02840 [Candidatus Marsarchaeota G2 archaeon ECH_B_SAG-F08]|jgi:NMD protein affecting ribosome stability and mRNA decay|uniref:Nmd3 N-terminal domain-containing protein n=8 Tax=Candidatus Marsarchaeota TaxID=1978152 RepID=A0A2R6BHM0_9ARCH|nr:MAG: hypothetical protein B9Q01_01010 [Candidatus Marsarchaeota G1 archaeon OSP_D]PSN86843.1 MAG: hypothetical protein B9Q02_00035 [Candidatus Marsarchaeota G1 archaeon BE_D]PSN89128.1 MAG: hypothetical protein B9Q00_02590 [Candidatus Marsarchaeota G1 archaeon OSP_C]PSN92850.1 MAG: hypothetical protein B9P99_03150 [Candidatus Marsarchaeota G1 archaeon OSP_B]PSN98146.1 MAG: hypothetical protein B9Q11_02780 [Candidatus Marsarchaeota G2 archaeon ECH_B_SAG-F08]PSO02759.1 MAG: hypothetical prote